MPGKTSGPPPEDDATDRPGGAAAFPLAGMETDAEAGGPACRVDALAGSGETAARVLHEVQVGLDPEGVVVDQATNRAFVACSRSNAVFIVDMDEMTVAGTIAVGGEPIDIVIDDATRRVFTADARADQLSVVDIDSCEVVATVPVGSYPAGLAIDPVGRRIYCGDTMGATMSVVDIDTLERIAVVEAELGAGAVAVDTRRSRAYCVNFITASVTVVDTDTFEVVDRVVVGEGPCAVAVNPVLDEYYVVNSLASTVARVDSATGKVLEELRVPNAPVGIAAGVAGDRIYLGNRGDGSMSVMGLDGREWARVPVGAAPGGVMVHPGDPGLLLVANAGTGTLSIIEEDLDGPPASRLEAATHRLVGTRLPEFELPDLRSGAIRHQVEWADKKYILNFFASW